MAVNVSQLAVICDISFASLKERLWNALNDTFRVRTIVPSGLQLLSQLDREKGQEAQDLRCNKIRFRGAHPIPLLRPIRYFDCVDQYPKCTSQLQSGGSRLISVLPLFENCFGTGSGDAAGVGRGAGTPGALR